MKLKQCEKEEHRANSLDVIRVWNAQYFFSRILITIIYIITSALFQL
jgi:hypothetical protein